MEAFYNVEIDMGKITKPNSEIELGKREFQEEGN